MGFICLANEDLLDRIKINLKSIKSTLFIMGFTNNYLELQIYSNHTRSWKRKGVTRRIN